MNLKAVTLVAAALLIPSLIAGPLQASASPGAEVAKAKKKKKKKKKRRAGSTQPTTVLPESTPPIPPVTCTDDAAEPNDSFPTASLLSVADPAASRILCPGNPDIYRVTVPDGYLIRATVDPDVYDAELEVYDGNGNSWGTVNDQGPGVAEFFELDNLYCGGTQTFFVRAGATTAEAGGDYTVRAQTVIGPNPC